MPSNIWNSVVRSLTLFLSFLTIGQMLVQPVLASRPPSSAYSDNHDFKSKLHDQLSISRADIVNNAANLSNPELFGSFQNQTGIKVLHHLFKRVSPIHGPQPFPEAKSGHGYTAGDVLKRMAEPFKLSQPAKLDNSICDHPVVLPHSPDKYAPSGAPEFASQWVKTAVDTPGFMDYVKANKLDAPTAFLNDLLVGANPLTCHIHKDCPIITCATIANAIRVKDPAIVHAVVYLLKATSDMFTVTRANLELHSHMQDQEIFDLPNDLKHFTWTEDAKLEAKCKQLADITLGVISAVVMSLMIVAGAFAPLTGAIAGAVGASAASGAAAAAGEAAVGAETLVIASVGVDAGMSAIVSSSVVEQASWISQAAARSAEFWKNGLKSGSKIIEAQAGAGFGVLGVGLTNYVGHADKGSLENMICDDVPRAKKGADEEMLKHMSIKLREIMSRSRAKTEEALNKARDWEKDARGNYTFFNWLEKGTFYLNQAAEKFYEDEREKALHQFQETQKTRTMMTVLQMQGSGVHCAFKPEICKPDHPSGVFCVEDHVSCQVFSYLPWRGKGGMSLIPHWGSRYLSTPEGKDAYGFETKDIAEQSWIRYKNRQFENEVNDFPNQVFNLITTRGQDTKRTGAYLPVCYEPEGSWPQGRLGPDPAPTSPNKGKLQPEDDKRFPCRCGTSMDETVAWLRNSGLADPYMVKNYGPVCQKLAVSQPELYKNPIHIYWASCLRWRMEDQTNGTHGYFDKFQCDKFLKEHSKYRNEHSSPVQATCKICLNPEFQKMLEEWHKVRPERPWHKPNLAERCDNFIKDVGCAGTTYSRQDERDKHTYCENGPTYKRFGKRQPVAELAAAIGQLHDDQQYVANEFIARWDNFVAFFGLVPEGKTLSGKIAKELIKKMAKSCRDRGNIAFNALGHENLNFKVQYVGYHHAKICGQNVCGGHRPHPALDNDPKPITDQKHYGAAENKTVEYNVTALGCPLPKFWMKDPPKFSKPCSSKTPASAPFANVTTNNANATTHNKATRNLILDDAWMAHQREWHHIH